MEARPPAMGNTGRVSVQLLFASGRCLDKDTHIDHKRACMVPVCMYWICCYATSVAASCASSRPLIRLTMDVSRPSTAVKAAVQDCCTITTAACQAALTPIVCCRSKEGRSTACQGETGSPARQPQQASTISSVEETPAAPFPA